MRIPQPKGIKGSLKWIQVLINDCSDLLNRKIYERLTDDFSATEWLSPRKDDEYAEYRDDDFLKVLGIEKYQDQLAEFWPKNGPQWDALGKLENRYYFLIEAKANIPEIISSCQAKHSDSKAKIKTSIERTKQFLNSIKGNNWYKGFYQYANRLCHLYFLREICGLNAYLVFIYFCNDSTHIPTNEQHWTGAIKLQKQLMHLNRHKFQDYVLEVFIHTEEMATH